jgi:two-component system chemotaxis response regulator CheB
MKYRVLVVDDSVVMRRIVRQALESDPEIEVAAVAANGRIALAMVEQHSLDAITLDIEMPEMDGLQTLREFRSRGVRTPVIMFSTLTERGALATLDALAAGADDYVAKPSNAGSGQDSILRIRTELIPKIKALCWRSSANFGSFPLSPARHTPGVLPELSRFSQPSSLPLLPVKAIPAHAEQRVEIVAIGTSTGGPNALAELIPRLPADFPVPILIVQHMPPTFTRFLAERLTTASSLVVEEGRASATLSPGHVWIAPGDYHMTLRREDSLVRLNVFQAPPQNSCRPSVDVLFRSVAELYGPGVLAVVMTGMGQDGLRGCEIIKEAHGNVIVQDEASSVVWGMPGYVAKAGLADAVLPVTGIADEMISRVKCGRRSSDSAATVHQAEEPRAHRAQGGECGA